MVKSLGKGLSALFGEAEMEYANARAGEGGTTEVAIGELYPNPNQPRKAFDENAMRDLANSVREHGVINPILVRRRDENGYMIIAGERRYRAATMAGLDTVPVLIREYTDREIQEISLIENLQREDLNPIEAATGMKKLMEEFGLTQELLAERLGKSRPAIANTLRLLTLSDDVIALVRDGKLSSGHARTFVPVPKEEQAALAQKCVQEAWSVRAAEREVKRYLNPPEAVAKNGEKKHTAMTAELTHFVERLRRSFGTKVSLIGTERKGRIYIDYYTPDDLDRISEILDIIEGQE